MNRDLRSLPKAHLHVHLEGAMRPSTLAELCGREGIAVPVPEGYGSFTQFADTYLAACDVIVSAEDLRRLVFEVVEDAANDGCVWMEPSFYPAHHVGRLGGERVVWEMVFEYGRAASERYGVEVGWMAAIDRTCGVEVADRVTDLVLDLVDEGAPIVAFGLHNDENGFPPEPFERQFAKAGEAGLLRTPHAGELDGPSSIRGALHVLGADRLQHGVRAVEDLALVDELAARGTVLDVCPTSNVMLSVVPAIHQHPLPFLLGAGVRCSVNGDDPLLFGPGILDEYELCRSVLGLGDEVLAEVAIASIDGSGAPGELKTGAAAAVRTWLAAAAPVAS